MLSFKVTTSSLVTKNKMSATHIAAGILLQMNPDDKLTFPSADYIRRFCLKRWTGMSSKHAKTLLVMHMMVPSTRLTEYTSQLRAMFSARRPVGHEQCLKSRKTLDGILRSRPKSNTSLYFINKLNLTDSDGSTLTFAERVSRHNSSVCKGHGPAEANAWVPLGLEFMDVMTYRETQITL